MPRKQSALQDLLNQAAAHHAAQPAQQRAAAAQAAAAQAAAAQAAAAQAAAAQAAAAQAAAAQRATKKEDSELLVLETQLALLASLKQQADLRNIQMELDRAVALELNLRMNGHLAGPHVPAPGVALPPPPYRVDDAHPPAGAARPARPAGR